MALLAVLILTIYLRANIASETARRYAGLILLIFAGATAGCIETIVHTTEGILAPTGARG